jgi:hypothetical protein
MTRTEFSARTGLRRLRLRPFDPSRDVLTEHEQTDARLLAMFGTLDSPEFDTENARAFCRLFAAIERLRDQEAVNFLLRCARQPPHGREEAQTTWSAQPPTMRSGVGQEILLVMIMESLNATVPRQQHPLPGGCVRCRAVTTPALTARAGRTRLLPPGIPAGQIPTPR